MLITNSDTTCLVWTTYKCWTKNSDMLQFFFSRSKANCFCSVFNQSSFQPNSSALEAIFLTGKIEVLQSLLANPLFRSLNKSCITQYYCCKNSLDEQAVVKWFQSTAWKFFKAVEMEKILFLEIISRWLCFAHIIKLKWFVAASWVVVHWHSGTIAPVTRQRSTCVSVSHPAIWILSTSDVSLCLPQIMLISGCLVPSNFHPFRKHLR